MRTLDVHVLSFLIRVRGYVFLASYNPLYPATSVFFYPVIKRGPYCFFSRAENKKKTATASSSCVAYILND